MGIVQVPYATVTVKYVRALSLYTKNKCAPPHPVRRLAEPFSTAMPALCPRKLLLAALLLMGLSACCEQIAQGVLFEEPGAHKRQIAGAIPTQLSQTDLFVASEFATYIPRFFTCARGRCFLRKAFSRVGLAGAHI